MARNALFRRRLVETTRLFPLTFASTYGNFAAHVAMRALQSETSLLVVIEQRRLPFRAVVTAAHAVTPAFANCDAMDICMACFALREALP